VSDTLKLVHCGDRSVLVYLGETIDPAVNDRVHALARTLWENRHPAVSEVVPSYHCLMVEYDPVRLRPDQMEELIRAAAAVAVPAGATARTVAIPVCYGGEAGPDLETVATHHGMTPEAVVQRHAQGLYRVYCLGFSPGFPYLGGLAPALHTPRLATPRTRVPAGSVAIGGEQTGVYPKESPGGWQLIGRTPKALFDPTLERPTLLEPGDAVRFVPISAEEYARLDQERTRLETPARQGTEGAGHTGLRVLQPGMATTIQDLGRRGYMHYGVPVAGASDFGALMVGNWLLGNRARTSALEITLTGPEVAFTGPVAFCLTGAPIPAELIPADGGSPKAVPGWTTVLASPGDRLRVGTATVGCRAYLCVAGGIDLPPVLGSLSEDLFGKVGPLGRPLKAGDWLSLGLPIHPPANLAGRSIRTDMIPDYQAPMVIRAVRGPQADAFTAEGLATFFSGEYVVSAQSDRQGLRLDGPKIAHGGPADILSEPIAAGSIQVPASGQPILLLGNRQTVGGYTKVAVAVYPDLSAASQLRPGDKVRFQEVDAAEAHTIAWAERRKLAQVRRYLEREISSGPEATARTASIPAVVDAPEPTAAPATRPSPEAEPPGAARTYRINILGIEFETTVEEITEP
jgi:KipI family sensor histidine kinase inhibitor